MDYFDKNAEMFRKNLKQYITIDLKNNYYAYQTKPIKEIDTYETISKRWGVSIEYVKELAEESGYTLLK